ncbi:MAG: M48 family metallopeptidase [Flavobacteriaceae bacterium]|nr:M48 family metallopeptidase [Flavobacteriaceae bacterium]
MKFIFTNFFALLFCTQILGQVSDVKMQEILDNYKKEFDKGTTIIGCGHYMDSFTYFAKQTENAGLDAALSLSGKTLGDIGYQIYQKRLSKGELNTSHSLLATLQNMLDKLARELNNPDLKFTMSVLKTDQPNAFATIGGYVYVTEGLLDFVDTYDELAFIIGHEIAHIHYGHSRRKITKMAITADLLNMTGLEGFTNIALNTNGVLSAPFDQIDEYESDKLGFEIALKAGYDRHRFADFFRKLAKNENKTLLNKLSSTHPFASDRENCINDYIKNQG